MDVAFEHALQDAPCVLNRWLGGECEPAPPEIISFRSCVRAVSVMSSRNKEVGRVSASLTFPLGGHLFYLLEIFYLGVPLRIPQNSFKTRTHKENSHFDIAFAFTFGFKSMSLRFPFRIHFVQFDLDSSSTPRWNEIEVNSKLKPK